jgi:hypothetical protein
MGARQRADEGKRDQETRGTRPDQSGTRRRPDDDGEVIEESELELLELVRPRRTSAPPPLPRTSSDDDRIDLEALLRQMAASSAPRTTTTPSTPIVVPPAPTPPRPQWGLALVVGTTAIVASSITAIVLTLTSRTMPPVPDEERKHEAPTPLVTVEPAAEEARPEAAVAAAADVEEPVRDVPSSAPRTEPEPEEPAVGRAAGEGGTRNAARARRTRAPAAPATASRGTMEPAEEVEAGAVEPEADGVAPQPTEAPTPQNVEVAEAQERARAETRDSPPGLAELMDRAAGNAQDELLARRPVETAADSTLPARPSRRDVDTAMHAVLPALRACAPGMDLVTVELHFAPTGRATTARVEGQHLSPAQRSCIARAARAAQVPAFGGQRLSVRYPVRL